MPVDYSCKTNRVFPIEIHDIDLKILPKYGFTYDTFFPEADDLAKFTAAILEHFYHNGISIFADYRYYPNQMISHKVFDALCSEI